MTYRIMYARILGSKGWNPDLIQEIPAVDDADAMEKAHAFVQNKNDANETVRCGEPWREIVKVSYVLMGVIRVDQREVTTTVASFPVPS